ncbi:hypothetical protein KOEU_19850 [Komagataeibacter europaeus]|uniref:Uncharacterized protein n=1 Tax=Komagataeibacter europaeus TaxID=33995 RepID=A0A0M0EI41_KOMEU|nr:hypothetical protein [Komagataeibacter europaeus]KON64581.1 hypothetical protein KOEU_19850 [Komagataeibacter europaeus]GBQ42726.1 hypothetical protein AA18890_1648 [Komagataeibacter europaeus LMG 18890]
MFSVMCFGLSIRNSISWNHATYDPDVTSAGVRYGTHGQQIINHPRIMYKASLTYTGHVAVAHEPVPRVGQVHPSCFCQARRRGAVLP